MTHDDMIKARIRARMEVTGEPYAEARRILLDYPMPTLAEIRAGDAIDYDPVLHQAMTDSTVPAGLARRWGSVAGAGPDSYAHTVPDLFGPPGPDGKLALIARPGVYQDLPVLAIECVEILQGHGKIPGAWWTSFGIGLCDRGWYYSTDGGGTPRGGASSSPRTVKHLLRLSR